MQRLLIGLQAETQVGTGSISESAETVPNQPRPCQELEARRAPCSGTGASAAGARGHVHAVLQLQRCRPLQQQDPAEEDEAEEGTAEGFKRQYRPFVWGSARDRFSAIRSGWCVQDMDNVTRMSWCKQQRRIPSQSPQIHPIALCTGCSTQCQIALGLRMNKNSF